jgi:hypothetical protein
MDTVLTMDEIRSRYDGEWVIIDEPELDEHLHVIQGAVVFHSRDRLEVDRKSVELMLPRSAVLHIGKVSADMEYAL